MQNSNFIVQILQNDKPYYLVDFPRQSTLTRFPKEAQIIGAQKKKYFEKLLLNAGFVNFQFIKISL